MPEFMIKAPDGNTYKITGDTEQGAVEALHQHLSPQTPQTPQTAAPKPLDKYQQAAVADRDAAAAPDANQSTTGGKVLRGIVGAVPFVGPAIVGSHDLLDNVTGGHAGDVERLATQGATMNYGDEVRAAANTPAEMYKHGTFDPQEGYKYAKAGQDLAIDDARKNTGLLGVGAELAGGVASGMGLARAGLTAAGAAPTIARVVGSRIAPWITGAADAAAQGAVAGSGEGNGLDDRIARAEQGGITGGVLGVTLPAVARVATAIARPLGLNAIAARINPEGFAEGKLAESVHNSGLTGAEIDNRIQQAAREGQGEFNVADAMGDSGQRQLGAAYRGSGPAGNIIEEKLTQRARDAADRMQGNLENAFDVLPGRTAEQQRVLFEQARSSRGNHEYSAVRAGVNTPVDVVPAINHLDANIGTQPGQQMTRSNDSIEAILAGYRQDLAHVDPNDFSAVQRIYSEMGDAAEKAARAGQNNRARLIRGAQEQLGNSMEGASPGFAEANRNFRAGSNNIEAVEQGQAAARSGRPENTLAEYSAMTPEQQLAYRNGYADRQIAKIVGKSENSNVALPFMTNKFRKEAAGMVPSDVPGQVGPSVPGRVDPNSKLATLQRQVARENTMADTRLKATGGSQTANNLAHDSDLGELTHVAKGAVHGGALGMAIGAMHAGINLSKGNTPEVKRRIAEFLLQNGAELQPGQLQQTVDRVVANMRFVQASRDAAARRLGGVIAGKTTQGKSER